MKTTIKLLAITAFMAISCNSDSDVTNNNGNNQDTSISADVKAQIIEEDVDGIKEEVLSANGYYASKNELQLPPSNCRTITQETLTDGGKKFKVDYGTGCIDTQGNNRTGIIYIVVHNNTTTGIINAAITFDNYYINSNKVEGTIDVTRQVIDNIPTHTRNTDISIIQPANGGTIHRTGDFTIEKIAGVSTPLVFTDDVFSIDGTATTTMANGTLLQMEITEPLIRDLSCGNITKGKKTLVRNLQTYILNYGSGACDNVAILTLPDGTQLTINI